MITFKWLVFIWIVLDNNFANVFGQIGTSQPGGGTRSRNHNACRVQNNRVLGQWQCDNGQIIDCNDLCNGRPNCADGSDETVISCRNVFCLDSAFRCSYGACIPANLECNGVADCVDNSDERTIRCPGVLGSIRSGGNCEEGFFQCKSGDCIFEDGVCSGSADCPDGSDETAAVCSTHFCPEPAFRCDYGACVLRMSRCDGKNDCVDGSDEKPELCRGLQNITRPRPPPPLSAGTRDPVRRPGPISIGSSALADQMTAVLNGNVANDLTANDVRELVAGYRRLLLRLEIQILQLQQENLRLRLGLNGNNDILDSNLGLTLDDLDILNPNTISSPIRTPSPLTDSTVIRPTTERVSEPLTSQRPPTPAPPPLRPGDAIKEDGDCDAPTIQGGRVSDVFSRVYNDRPIKNGEMVIFECLGGSRLDGVNSTYCIRGAFLNDIPQCSNFCSGLPLNTLSVQATCHNPTGDVIPCAPLLPPRTIAILSCKVGYKKPDRVVPDAYTCMDDGNWNAHVYKCQQICGEISEGRRLIVGGVETNITQVPWHAGIYEERNGRMEQICGGSILNPTAIVSAAHCFWDQQRGQIKPASLYRVAVGKTLREFTADEVTVQRFNVTEIDVYDQYRDYEGLFVSDIAVIILDRPIIFQSFVKPVCVDYNLRGNERYVVSGIQGRVAGWGLTTSGGVPSPALKVIDLPTVDFNTCLAESPASFRPFITTDKFCAGFTTGDSVCTGDSGGGLAFQQVSAENTTVYFLRGIVSFGPRLEGSCDNTKYSAFTDIQLNIIFLYKYIVN